MNEIIFENLSIIFNNLHTLVSLIFLIFLPLGIIIRSYGISRERFSLSTSIILVSSLPIIITSSFLFGWAISFTMINGPGITGNFSSIKYSAPWSSFMGPNLSNEFLLLYKKNIISFFVFVIIAWSIVLFLGSAVVERIRNSAFLILSIIIGSIFWPIALSWGWSSEGWMIKVFGFHDAFGAGAIHTLIGGFGLGVISQLNPRLVKFSNIGKPREIYNHNSSMIIFGKLLIIIGLLGLYLSAMYPFVKIENEIGIYIQATNNFGSPISISGSLLNFLLSLSGGMLMSIIISKNNPKWIFAGGIIGIITTSAGADYYFPLQSFLIAMISTYAVFKSYHYVEERFKLDDITGIITIHGFSGFWGLIIAGILLWGYPSSIDLEGIYINPFGQFAGAIILFWILGYIPGYLSTKILKFFEILELSQTVQIAGQDIMIMRDDYLNKQDLNNVEKNIVKENTNNLKLDE